MKFNHLLALTSISLLAMSNSCEKTAAGEDPCPTSTLNSTPVTGLNCIIDTFSAVGESKSYVVTSAAQYKALFTCANLPAIDFDTSTLLTGSIQSPVGGLGFSQQLVQTCQGYTCTVRVKEGLTAVYSILPYSIVVPKLPPNAQVKFDVQLIP